MNEEEKMRARRTHLDDRRDAMIAEYGHMVMMIFPTQESLADGSQTPQFWYSVGRCLQNKPEFLVTGPISQDAGYWIVNEAARLYDAGKLGLGDRPAGEFLENYPVRIIEADPHAAQMNMAYEVYMDNAPAGPFEAWQIIWPDLDGRWPGDEGFSFDEPVFPA